MPVFTPSDLGRRPLLTAAMGALCIAVIGRARSAVGFQPETVALFRCLLALPALAAANALETRSAGPLSTRTVRLSWIAGFFFSVDLILWHNAIDAVGAGLATVLGNLQVVLVGFAAWVFIGERPQRTLFWAIPIMLVGVVLVSGVVGGDAYGDEPALGVLFGIGTSIAYAAFLLILRQGSSSIIRVAGPLFHATLASTIFSAVYGILTSTIEWTPGWPAIGWLLTLALTSQVMGWLLISSSLPRLPAAITSAVLLLQPVGAMVLAAGVLDERPSPAAHRRARDRRGSHHRNLRPSEVPPGPRHLNLA